MAEAPPTARGKMAKAAFQALGAWLVIYFCLMHCFVVWNWDNVVVPQTLSVETSKTIEAPATKSAPPEAKRTPPEAKRTPPKKKKPKLTEEQIKLDPRYQELDTVLEELKSQVQAHDVRRRKLRQWSRLMQAATERLGRVVEIPSLQVGGADDEEAPALKHLEALLQVPSLQEAYPTTGALTEAFEAALVDIHTAMDGNASGAVLSQLLKPVARVPFSCPSHEAVGLDQATIDHGLSALEQTFAAGQANYPDGLPVSFSETYDRLLSDLERAYAEAFKQAQHEAEIRKDSPVKRVPSGSAENTENCLEDEMVVLDWLEAGLDAMYRQRDVRKVLLKAMQDSGVDGVILDADLGGGGSTETTRPTAAGTTLRQLLDTPLTRHVPDVINGAIDLTSGYVDALDEWIDQTSSRLPDGNLGKALVKATLEAAGKVPIPALPQQGGLLK